MDKIIDINLYQLALSYVFVLILLAVVRIKKIPREWEILIATFRMTLQLIITGHILVYVIDNPSPFYTLLILLVMEVFAIFNSFKRVKYDLSRNLKLITALSLSIGTVASIFYFLFVVVRINPWFKPQYFIPIAGMLIGNSMTGISLGITKLMDGFTDGKSKVEGALMLGATPTIASREIVNKAFDSAILPTINSMVSMGIVSLPGMMTGQILSGTSPLTAISYQIAIMLGILGSVTLSVLIFLNLGYRTFFNEEKQLI